MIRITTKSGAVYHVDTTHNRVTRTGPHSPGINYDAVPDDQWHTFTDHAPFNIGEPTKFHLTAGRYRITTPITTLEEDDL